VIEASNGNHHNTSLGASHSHTFPANTFVWSASTVNGATPQADPSHLSRRVIQAVMNPGALNWR
jgi:hypothetical protein